MDPIPVLLILALGYVAYSSGALAGMGLGSPAGSIPGVPLSATSNPEGLQPGVSVTAPQVGQTVNAMSTPQIANTGPAISAPVTGVNKLQLAITSGTSIAVGAMAPASFVALGLTGAAAGAAVAGVGALVAISLALYMAHVARVKEAKSENSAMNLGVTAWDADLLTVNKAYVSRQIDATGAIQLVQQIQTQFWQLVTPHIQPGRNGCNGGTACPYVPAGIVGGKNPCTGNIGAVCCVGCYDLVGDTKPVAFPGMPGPMYFGTLGTVMALQHGGGKVYYQAVNGSSYGGKARPAYVLDWTQAAAA